MASSELVQAVVRGLDILSAVGGSPEGVSLRELAAGLELKTTTVHNLARTLVAKGCLVKRGQPVRYFLGPLVTELAERCWEHALVVGGSREVLGLADAFSAATVVLVEPVGDEVVCRLRVSPDRPGVVARPRGQVMHPYGTAAGMVFQAFWPDEQRVAYQRRYPLVEFGGHLWSSQGELDDALVRIRRDGFAAPTFEHKGVCATAAPVLGGDGDIVACVGVSMPADAVQIGEREMMILAAVESAGRLSALQ